MSIILAIEQSTPTGSVAVMNGRAVLAERSWTEDGSRHQQLFAVLPGLLTEASVEAGDIEQFAVGLGPGAFAGLRISISAARAWALPGQCPVHGVSSGEAVAREVFDRTGAPSITILGDARRHRFWYGRFHAVDGRIEKVAPYALVPTADLASVVEKGSVVATPHWDRIGKELSALARDITLVQEPCLPRARIVGELVLDRIDRGQPMDELKPIYMHPPVFVEPRFPA